MQFGMMLVDTGFSFGNPQMALAAVYGSLWLLLAVFLVFARGDAAFPKVPTLIVYALIGLSIPNVVVLGVINMLAPSGITIGMPWGRPPLWLPLSSLIGGSLLGRIVRRRRDRQSARPEAQDPKSGPRLSFRQEYLRALVLSLVFPGTGQVYRQRALVGLLLFAGLALISSFFKMGGFVVGYTLIQVDNLMKPSLSDRIVTMMTGRRLKGGSAPGNRDSSVN